MLARSLLALVIVLLPAALLAQTGITINTTLSTNTTLSSPTTIDGATLTVDSGAAVDTTTLRLGGTSAGHLLLDGSGTTFTASQFYLGDAAAGSITLRNHATLNAGSFLVSTVGGPFATALNFGAAAAAPAALAGVFNPTTLTIASGANLTVQFNTLNEYDNSFHVTSTGLEAGAAINFAGPVHLVQTNGVTFLPGAVGANSRITGNGGDLYLTGSLGSGAVITVAGGYVALPDSGPSLTSATVTGGTLSVGNDTVIGSLLLDGGEVAGSGFTASTVTLSSGDLNAGISGSLQLLKSGAGTVNLNAELSHTGGTLVTGGTLSLQGDAIVDHSGADFLIAPTGNATVENSGRINAANIILGSAGGTASLIVSGSDDKGSGGTLQTGSLQSGSSTSTVTFNYGTLIATGDNPNVIAGFAAGHAQLSGAGLTVESDYAIGSSVIFSGDGALTKTGTGTFTLSGNQAYTGATSVDGGTLNLTGTTASTRFNLNAGTLDLNGKNLTVTAVGVGNGTLLNGTIAATDLYVRAGTFVPGITFTGALINEGSDTLSISSAQTYTGGTVLNGGNLQVSADNHLGAAPGTLTLGGGTLQASGSFTSNRALIFAGGYSGFRVDDTVTLTLNGTGTGTGGLVKKGGGTLALNGAHSFTGSIEVNQGTLIVGSGGSFNLGSNGVVAAQYSEIPGQTVNTANFTVAGGIVTTEYLRAGYVGTIGEIRVSAGSLTSTTETSLGSSGTGTLTITGGHVSTPIVHLAQSGYGTGTVALNGGTLTTSQIARWSTGSSISFDGGTLRAASNTAALLNGFTSGSAVIHGGGLTIDTNTFTVATLTEFTGTGGITKTGAGTLTLTGISTHTGATTISAGTLTLGSINSLAHSSAIHVAAGATLDGSAVINGVTVASGRTLSGSGTVVGPVAIASGAILAPGSSPGTLTFTGGLTLAGGSILDFQLGNTSDLIRVSGGTLSGPLSGLVTLNLANAGGFTAGTYTLFDFTSAATSSFDVGDFTFGSTLPGYTYALALTGSTLELTATGSAIPEPSTYAALVGLAALALAAHRRRRP
jgi:autotransporter-associated beta strand protein